MLLGSAVLCSSFPGLEGAVFSLLDRECNRKLISDSRDLLIHIVQAVALDNLAFWVDLCKSVLAASTGTSSCDLSTLLNSLKYRNILNGVTYASHAAML